LIPRAQKEIADKWSTIQKEEDEEYKKKERKGTSDEQWLREKKMRNQMGKCIHWVGRGSGNPRVQ